VRKVKVVVWEDEKVEKEGSRADATIFSHLHAKMPHIQVYMRANTQ